MLDGQDEDEVGSLKSGTSGGESYKSFEDVVWYEAERAAEADIRDGERSQGGAEIGRAVRGRPKINLIVEEEFPC